MPAIPFTDPPQIAPLYATAGRLARRTGALHAAKISGGDATTTITDIAARIAPTFLAFPPKIRKIIYTTNAVESLNSRFRQATRRRGHFPNEPH
jgi:hypothetical protein